MATIHLFPEVLEGAFRNKADANGDAVHITLASNLHISTLQALRANSDGIEGLLCPAMMRQWCHNDEDNLCARRKLLCGSSQLQAMCRSCFVILRRSVELCTDLGSG